MSRWGTYFLALLAVGAAVFLFVIEPRLTSTREAALQKALLLPMAGSDIQGFRIMMGDDVVTLERRGTEWRVGPKPRDRASAEQLANLVAAVEGLQVLDRVDASEFQGDLQHDDFGVEDSKLRLEVLGEGGGTIYFGKEAVGKGRVYARRSDATDVVVIDDRIMDLAFRPAREFRDPRLTSFRLPDLDRVIIRRPEGEIELKQDAQGWEIVRPLRARASEDAIAEFLRPLLTAEIGEFVADESDDLSAFGLSEPRWEIIIYAHGEERPHAVRIGDETEGGIIAQYTGRDSVYKLPLSIARALAIHPDDLRDRRLLDLNLDTVDRIVWESGGQAKELRRTEEAWSDADGVERTEVEVSADVAKLVDAEVKQYLPATRPTLDQRGFANPVAIVRFDAWLSENTPEATAGRLPIHEVAIGSIKGDLAYVRIDDEPEIVVVATESVASWLGSGNKGTSDSE